MSAYPYRVDLREKPEALVHITIRTFRDKPQKHHVKLKLTPGVTADPPILTGSVPAQSRRTFPVMLSVDREKVPPGVQIVTFDITLDGRRHGELFDFLVSTPGR